MDNLVLRLWDDHPYYFINGKMSDACVRALSKELSYEDPNKEKVTSFKRGEWDGKYHLLHRAEDGVYYFPGGLFDKATAVIGYYHEFEVDGDFDIDCEPDIGLEWISDKRLYDYQMEAATAIYLSNGGVMAIPTGAGKTIVAAWLMHGINKRTLVIVHRKELLNQWVGVMDELFGIQCGVYGSGKRDVRDVTIGMLQTIRQDMRKGRIAKDNKDLLTCPVLIVDECHHIPANDAYAVAMGCSAKFRIGCSATPYRTDGAEMKIWGGIGEIRYKMLVEDLIDRGVLATPTFRFIRPPPFGFCTIGKGAAAFQDAYNRGIVGAVERNILIAAEAKRLVEAGHKVYIHVERVLHGEILESLIPGSVFVHGGSKKKFRTEVIEEFADGNLDILVSTLLGEGVDMPKVSAIIMAGGLKTAIGTIQRVGRVLRKAEGIDEAIVVDFADSGKYIGQHWQERINLYRVNYGKYVK